MSIAFVPPVTDCNLSSVMVGVSMVVASSFTYACFTPFDVPSSANKVFSQNSVQSVELPFAWIVTVDEMRILMVSLITKSCAPSAAVTVNSLTVCPVVTQ